MISFDLLSAVGGAVGGALIMIFSKAGQEMVVGYLGLASARRHVMDMLIAEAVRRPIIKKTQVGPGIWDVTAAYHSATRSTREALLLYLEAAKKSPFRRRRDQRAVTALAPRLQFATSEVGQITFLAICKLISPRLSAPSIQAYVALVGASVRAGAALLPEESVEEMSSRACNSLLRDIEEVLQALPGHRQRKEESSASGRPWIFDVPEAQIENPANLLSAAPSERDSTKGDLHDSVNAHEHPPQ